MLTRKAAALHLTVAKAGGARGSFPPAPFSVLCCRIAMLVPDRLCLALWPVLSGALSVGRRLWSLMRLHAKIAEHRVTTGDMVE